MIPFYGAKGKLVKYYPTPIYDKIIEPFAGSAKYSLAYWEKDVTISDIDPIIISVWKYLKSANPAWILSLPDVPNATVLKEIDGYNQLLPQEKWLIGFCSNGGSAQPKNVSGRHNFNSWNRDKLKIAKDLHKIKHWNILEGSYGDLSNDFATWFIDPPYKEAGKWYKFGSSKIDYDDLGRWCERRFGQVIVCENEGANWLPFRHLKEIPFSHFKTDKDKKRKSVEVIWTKGE